ncbi:hypothetical protein E2C01_055393 [Portunus trituberculatus]|uniref:Uncharacterized protein n=1 Tax=Portunus trituberculatus TaxID=210409 RepID=A0A5B7GUL6_PORTR|nr:hypothetical protein [Portunus trituberculatus]
MYGLRTGDSHTKLKYADGNTLFENWSVSEAPPHSPPVSAAPGNCPGMLWSLTIHQQGSKPQPLITDK